MNKHDHLQMLARGADAFANDGVLSGDELAELIDIALRDGHFSKDEVRVLENLLAKLQPGEVTGEIQCQLRELFNRHQISLNL